MRRYRNAARCRVWRRIELRRPSGKLDVCHILPSGTQKIENVASGVPDFRHCSQGRSIKYGGVDIHGGLTANIDVAEEIHAIIDVQRAAFGQIEMNPGVTPPIPPALTVALSAVNFTVPCPVRCTSLKSADKFSPTNTLPFNVYRDEWFTFHPVRRASHHL